MSAHTERVAWRFHGRDRHGNPVEPNPGVVVLDSREIRCYDGETLAWTRTFKTRALARASFEGDLRAMRKNDCYEWIDAGAVL